MAADRVDLRVSDVAATPVPPAMWLHLRPRPGIRVVPRGDNLRFVLLVAVSIAALAIAPAVAGLFGITSKLGVDLGLNIVGSLWVNSPIPVETSEADITRNTYSLNGWQNTVRRAEPVPFVPGRMRYVPPLSATSCSMIVGDEQEIVTMVSGDVWSSTGPPI